ncbi:MAG: LysR family transcriptional regulator, partial [Paracoccaceae bacterium]|nr:LysR family transcriptional regulator [Paracoccaceae bacterium]
MRIADETCFEKQFNEKHKLQKIRGNAMPLSLRAMRYLRAALQHGSMTAAAEAMHVAPSAFPKSRNKPTSAANATTPRERYRIVPAF